MSGRTAKCPKCGVAVQIPEPTGAVATATDSGTTLPSSDPAHAGNGSNGAPAAQAPSDSGSHSATPAEDHDTSGSQTITFLCPNQHKLTAPATLQGRPGKCPHCGAKFLIPMLDAGTEEAAEEDGAAFLESLGSDTNLSDAMAEAEAPADELSSDQLGLHFDLDALGIDSDAEQDFSEGESSDMARLLAQLWPQRGEHGTIDLHLKGGQVVTPDWFAPRLSQHSYGMFANQADDGSFSLTVVQWDAIERIDVRGLDGLPEGTFE